MKPIINLVSGAIYASWHALLLGAFLCGINYNVSAATAPVQLTIGGRSTDGGVVLKLTGPAPCVYILESSADLDGGTPFATNILLEDTFIVTNTPLASVSGRYYRARLADDPPYMPAQVIMRYKTMFSTASIQAATVRARLSNPATVLVASEEAPNDPPVLLMETSLPASDAARQLTNDPAVDFAEPNWIVKHHAGPNDPLFMDGSLWGMYGDASSPANAFGWQAAEAWIQGYTGCRVGAGVAPGAPHRSAREVFPHTVRQHRPSGQ